MQHSDINAFMFAHDFSPYFRPNIFIFKYFRMRTSGKIRM